jgi:hypothetical protein
MEANGYWRGVSVFDFVGHLRFLAKLAKLATFGISCGVWRAGTWELEEARPLCSGVFGGFRRG